MLFRERCYGQDTGGLTPRRSPKSKKRVTPETRPENLPRHRHGPCLRCCQVSRFSLEHGSRRTLGAPSDVECP
jgi:hypothetical protein